MTHADQQRNDPTKATQLPAANRETIAQIQENLTAYFRLFADLPGVTFMEEEGVTWIASQGAPGSLVLRTQILDESIEQRIDTILRQIGHYTTAVDWFVFPSCQPPDLGEHLATYGLASQPHGEWMLVGKIGGPGGTWMVRDLVTLPRPPAVSKDFHVEYVVTEQMLAAWLQVSLTGFGHASPPHASPPLAQITTNPFYAAYARHGFGTDASSHHYIGYLGDQPVTASTLCLAGGIAGLFDISTPPAFRRQGAGSAISWAMLQKAQLHGYTQAYVWSSPMGRNVYQGIGFVPVDIGMCEYQWQKR